MSYRFTPRYHEIDGQGVMFYMWYLGHVGEAVNAFFSDAGLPHSGWPALGFDTHVVHVRFAGAGRVLQVADLAQAHAVLLTTGDQDLEQAVAQCLQAPPRSCSLWLHTSGRHDLQVLAPLAALGATWADWNLGPASAARLVA